MISSRVGRNMGWEERKQKSGESRDPSKSEEMKI